MGRDLALAWRALCRQPSFTIVAVLTLGVGIGLNTVVFTVTDAVLFKGFPLVERNDRLVYMTTGVGCCVSYPDFEDWRAQATSFDGMAIVHGVAVTLAEGGGLPERHDATEVSAGTFTLAGVRPVLGRDFTAADETPGAAPVAILRHGFWERRFARDPAVIGRILHVDGVPTTIVGVMPQGFSFPQNQDLWIPLVATPEVRRRDVRNTWFVLGRLAPGITLERARAEMETIGRRLGRAYPDTNQGRNLLPHVLTFEEFFIGASAGTIYRAMWAAAGLVLLMACANLANLLLARATARAREMSLRLAIGAGRMRIVRQLLVESLVLATLGGLLGWCLAGLGVRVYALAASGPAISGAINGTWFNDVLDYSMDYRVFAYLAVLSLGTGLLFGLVPASRLSRVDVVSAIKDGGRSGTAGRNARRLPAALIVVEMALAVVLLAAAGVLIRSVVNVYSADRGFRGDNVLTALVSLPSTRYADGPARIAFFDRLEARLASLPGVETVTTASTLPGTNPGLRPYEVAGATFDSRDRPTVGSLAIDVEFFRTIGTTLVAGREFRDEESAAVAVVNEAFARRHWPGVNPLGQRLRLFDRDVPEPWLMVVGVAPDLSHSRLPGQRDPVVYLPVRQRAAAGSMWVMAAARVPPGALASSLRREVHAIDPELPLANEPAPLVERLARASQYTEIIAVLFTTFAAIALLLASVGLYAVVAHSVNGQVREIGIRLAIGATSRDIARSVLLEGLLPVAAGLTIGLAGSAGATRLLRSELVHVSPNDPLTLVAVSAILIASAAIGCWVPARRALRVDPAVTLLHE